MKWSSERKKSEHELPKRASLDETLSYVSASNRCWFRFQFKCFSLISSSALFIKTQKLFYECCGSAQFIGAFRLYDVDNDGFITRDEMYNIVDAIYQMVVSVSIVVCLQFWVPIDSLATLPWSIPPPSFERKSWRSTRKRRSASSEGKLNCFLFTHSTLRVLREARG